MEGEKVTLEDMLTCRERRADRQHYFLCRYETTLISFCMNIPGPVKTNAQIRRAFSAGEQDILQILSQNQIPVLDICHVQEKTGDELLISADGNPVLIKRLAVKIEDTHPFGRLFDIDVICTDGRKLSRKAARRCIICGRQAHECARARRHTIEELQCKISALLQCGLT